MTSEDIDDLVKRAKNLTSAQTQVTNEALAKVRNQPSRREINRRTWRIVAVASFVTAGVAIGVSLFAVHETASETSARVAHDAAASAQVAADQSTAQAAYTQAQAANEQLKAQGKPQVPIPVPTQGDTTNTLVSAAAAQVLASLPANIGQPTAQALGAAIANYIAANPQGPTAAQIAAQVSTYFAANSDQFKGQTGDRGTGITAITCDNPSSCGVLTISLSDGTSTSFTLPAGPQGEQGVQGASGATGATGPPPGTYTVQVPLPLGGTTPEVCTPTTTDANGNPTGDYDCK